MFSSSLNLHNFRKTGFLLVLVLQATLVQSKSKSNLKVSLKEPEVFQVGELDRKKFTALVRRGKTFVVRGLAATTMMTRWDCDFWMRDVVFHGVEARREDGNEDDKASFIKLFELAREASPKFMSGGVPQGGPKLGSFYLGAKEAAFASDAHPRKSISGSWTRPVLERIQRHTSPPGFMEFHNDKALKESPEVWFATAGGGTRAHVDRHEGNSFSMQLAGRKSWRLSALPAVQRPHVLPLYREGVLHAKDRSWRPTHQILLLPGDAIFFGPGTVHETVNREKGRDRSPGASICTASITYRFDVPMPSVFYRDHVRPVRFTPDLSNAWPLLRRWATLGQTLNASAGANETQTAFERLDRTGDGKLRLGELQYVFNRLEAEDALAFHDLNGDGSISIAEWREVFQSWADNEQSVMSAMPHVLLPYAGICTGRSPCQNLSHSEKVPEIPASLVPVAQAFESQAQEENSARVPRSEEQEL